MMASPKNGCNRRPCRPSVKLSFRTLARRGHQRCHCNEESFGTLSRQLGNDEGYRSPRVGVSGWSQVAAERAKDARNRIGRLRHQPRPGRMGGLRTAF